MGVLFSIPFFWRGSFPSLSPSLSLSLLSLSGSCEAGGFQGTFSHNFRRGGGGPTGGGGPSVPVQAWRLAGGLETL